MSIGQFTSVGFQNAAQVIANTVIIEGANQGWFIYNGTAGPGNPPIDYATAPSVTTDPYGNALPTGGGGIVTVDPGASFAELLDGGMAMGLLGVNPSVIVATIGVADYLAGQAVEISSGSIGSDEGSLMILSDSGAGGVLQIISGSDGSTYDTMRLTMQTTASLDVDSTSPVTLFTFPVAAKTYAYQLEIPMQGTGTGIPQIRFSTAAATETEMQGETVLDGGTAGGYTAWQTVLNTFGPVGPALVNGDAYHLAGSGIIDFSVAGTIAVEMNASTAVATCTIPIGARMHLLPVTGTAGGGGGGASGDSLVPLTVISVLTFGAIPDGVTDSTAAIQAAANFAVSIGAWLWFPVTQAFPNAIYRASTITMAAGMLWRGNSSAGFPGVGSLPDDTPGISVIARTATSNENLLVFPAGADYGRIRDLAIDGDKTQNTQGYGLYFEDVVTFEDSLWKIDDCYIHDNPQSGVYSGAEKGGNEFTSCFVNDNGQDGYTLAGPDTKIFLGSAGNNARAGVCVGTTETQNWAGVGSGGGATYISVIQSVDIYENDVGIAVASGASGCMIIANGIDRNNLQGITVFDGDAAATIVGNTLHSNSAAANDTSAHIDVGINVVSVVIDDNIFAPQDGGFPNVASYGVNNASTASKNPIMGNIGILDSTATVGGLLSAAADATPSAVVLSNASMAVYGISGYDIADFYNHTGVLAMKITQNRTIVYPGTFQIEPQASAPGADATNGTLYVANDGSLHYLGPTSEGATDTEIAPG